MIKRMLWLMMILMICLNGISMAEETTIHSVTTLAVGETVKLDETWLLTLRKVELKQKEIVLTMEISCAADDGLTAAEKWQQDETWNFQLLSESGDLEFRSSTYGREVENGQETDWIGFWLCYEITGEYDNLYLYPRKLLSEDSQMWLLDQGTHGQIVTSTTIVPEPDREHLIQIMLPDEGK
jgi:hypothetical protein